MLTFIGCNSTDSLNPESSTPAGTDAGVQVTPADAPSFAGGSFSGGIPFGTFAQPTTEFGSRYNGAMRNISPGLLLQELAAIKARGGRVALMFAGNEGYYKTGGRFDFNKWKARINRFKGVNFSSYISDGTIIGHYMVDEPNDPANWGGQPISTSTVDAMAQYSKSLWSGMATIARVDPAYFGGRRVQYLDAAWAQYLARRGNPASYVQRAASDAQKAGLALVVGLNFVHGGTPTGTQMSASEVESFGSALLSSSYPCAFISWQYRSSHLSSNDMKSAMDALRRKAESRPSKSCRGG
jgi:hypothetical protein